MTPCWLCTNPATTSISLGWRADQGEVTVGVCSGCKRELEAERDWSVAQ
jgi:hypothetical protein